MKKQFFLLSVLLAVANFTTVIPSNNCCDTTCNTSCDTSCNTSCNTPCVPSHGHTFMALTPEFAAARPERVALFENTRLENLKHDDKHGNFQVVVFGGQSTKGSQTAAYYLPYGHQCLTFDGTISKAGTFASDLAESSVTLGNFSGYGDLYPKTYDEISLGANYVQNGYETIAVDPATYKFDLNKDTSKMLPWNFGITFAALFEPRGAAVNGALVGTGLITNPAFKSTICPCLKRWHVGAGLELTYHFSDEPDGWYMRLSTAVEHVSSQIKLNETVVTEKGKLDSATVSASNIFGNALGFVHPNLSPEDNGVFNSFNANYYDFYINPLANKSLTTKTGYATVTPVGSLKEAYLGYNNDTLTYKATGFPIDSDGATAVAPNNVTEAFNQNAWTYGKIGCANKITRLADIELSIGRLWTCGECATTMWELGVLIPTGNKPCATWVAPAVVGNGQHAGIRVGSTTTVMISQNDESSTWFTLVYDGRYLFRNTQKRSFDLKDNEWSRYMMVWANKDAYSAAVDAFALPFASNQDGAPQRGYTPGINVFTTDFYVKPQLQQRLNQAVFYMGEKFRAELGWNLSSRQKECVQLSCGWDQKPAFADSSDIGGIGLNNNRKIYNDSQTTVVNSIDSVNRGFTLANLPMIPVTTGPGLPSTPAYYIGMPTTTSAAALTVLKNHYDDFAITEADINFDSVATDAAISYIPYLALGYAFDYDCKPVLSVGASYEFTASNRSLNQWMVWGKFEVAF